MNISIAVYGAPHSSQAAYTAYRFSRAALEKGHSVRRVFFYHDGVYNATTLSVPPRDEFDLCDAWLQLKKNHGLELIVCIAAALRRGILDQAESRRHEKDAANLPAEFELSGLGQLVESAAVCDRFVTFGSPS